ncbi:toll/interleukin-1 receptor domain-containing protein [Streptomyces sp. BBFR2]|uniref:toll/interleukin-1 receptor domain-containing protein n=1 Tax=Streptomyces sp. BBFR2 TaxID=3372854 RepID=UPI0037D9D599
MRDVFINYRTKDEEATATTLDVYLSQGFGTDQVFRAGKSIEAGQNFRKELVAAARRCHVLLAVIGPDWLTVQARDGRRALDVPEDWTRREILEASASAQVIPVLVGDTLRLQRAQLPKALAWLADCQYRRLYHRDHTAGLQRIGDDIAELAPHLTDADRQAAEEKTRGTAGAVGGNQVEGVQAQAGTIHQNGGIGNLAGGFHGTYFDRPNGPVNTGSGSQHTAHHAPQFSGNGANYVAGDVTGQVGDAHIAGDQNATHLTGDHIGTHHDNRRAAEDSDR